MSDLISGYLRYEFLFQKVFKLVLNIGSSRNSYRFLTETCGLKILKSESGRTFRISNKLDISIMMLLISDRG